jgi:hypothetical protein
MNYLSKYSPKEGASEISEALNPPGVNPRQYSYIKRAYYTDSYKIRCEFENGRTGDLHLSDYKNLGGVFEKLNDPEYAASFKLVEGILTWGDGELDIAPETVYHKATGEPLPDWME